MGFGALCIRWDFSFNSLLWLLTDAYKADTIAGIVCSYTPFCINRDIQTMLVLTRKINESIMINDNIEVVIVDVRGDYVKLGLKAPLDVSINRKEVYDEICAANLDSAKVKLSDFKKLALIGKRKDK